MASTWFTANLNLADAHGWANKFDREAHSLFLSQQERDEAVIARWNTCVKPGDKVYVLGDVGFDRDALASLLPRLNGHKRLLLGDQDHLNRVPALLENFGKIFLQKDFSGFVCSHMPMMRPVLRTRDQVSVHGHLYKRVMQRRCPVDKVMKPDPQYINICIENTDYTPIHLDALQARVDANRKLLRP